MVEWARRQAARYQRWVWLPFVGRRMFWKADAYRQIAWETERAEQ